MKKKGTRQADQKGKAGKNKVKVAEAKRQNDKLAKLHTKNPWCKCKGLFSSVLPTWLNRTITYSTTAEKGIFASHFLVNVFLKDFGKFMNTSNISLH